MSESDVVADYVIKGAGAAGMAFADSVLAHSDATVVLVDRHDRPGGHWNDVYPFVRLHQPSAFYGVNSTDLGTGSIDHIGLNAGYHELASGHEIVAYYDVVLRHRLLPSGRVRFFPMSELGDDGVITSLLSGERQAVEARRFVDATHSRMQVPSLTPPDYTVDDVSCVPLNDLPRVAGRYDEFMVIGAGKTGMDACIWLLTNGVDPDRIRWIVSRDSWVLGRGNVQPGDECFAAFCKSLADQVECAAHADSVDDVFVRLEAVGELRRIDPDVTPEAYHCAILSDAELAQLRRIRNVVRLGRVRSIGSDEIALDRGTISTGPTCLHVDCSAAGIPGHPSKPVFDGDWITLQWVRTCQPTFSAAMIGFVESTFADDDVKNRICSPIAPPTVPLDWMRMLRAQLANHACWSEFPEIDAWLATARLDPFNKYAKKLLGVDPEVTAHLQRYMANVGGATANIDRLLAHAMD